MKMIIFSDKDCIMDKTKHKRQILWEIRTKARQESTVSEMITPNLLKNIYSMVSAIVICKQEIKIQL